MQQVSTTTRALVNGLEKVELRLAPYGQTPLEAEVVSCTLNLSCGGGERFSVGSACPQSARLVLDASAASGLQGELVQVSWAVESARYPLFTGYVLREQMAGDALELELQDALYIYGDCPFPGDTASLTTALEQIAGVLGTTLAEEVPELTGKTADFDGLPANSTCAQVLAMIAALLGCNAFLDREGRLTLRPCAPVDHAAESYEGSSRRETEAFSPQGLTFLRTGEDEQGALVEQRFSAGDGSLVLENPLADQSYAELAWSRMAGLCFYAGQFSIPGGLLLEPGDIIEVDGLPVACSALTMTIDGGVKTDVTSLGEEDTGGARGSLTNRVDAAVERMEQIQQQVVAEKNARQTAVEELNAALADASGLFSTAREQEDGSVIYYLHDRAALAESTLVVKVTNEGIGVSNDGGVSFASGFTFDGDAILNELYATGIYGVKIIGEAGSMGGFAMTEHTLSAEFRYEFPAFTTEDISKVQAYLLGTGTLTDEELERYDVNMDGSLNTVDLFVMQRMINGLEEAYTEGTVTINAADPKRCIRIEVTGGYRAGEVTWMGLGGINASRVVAGGYTCGDSRGVSATVPGGAALRVLGGIVTGYDTAGSRTLRYDCFSGLVTGSGKNLYFTVPMVLPDNVSSIALSGTVVARGVQGYLVGDADTASLIELSGGEGYTVKVLPTTCGFRVQVAFDEVIYNAVNNTPVSVMPYGAVTVTLDAD